MDKVLVAVEKGDGRHLNIKKILNDIKFLPQEARIWIVYYGSTDNKYIEKLCQSKEARSLFDIERIDLEKIKMEKRYLDEICEDTDRIVKDGIPSRDKNNDLSTVATLYYRGMFNSVKVALILKTKLKSLLVQNEFIQYILIGKKNSSLFPVELYPLKSFNYGEQLSAVFKKMLSDEELLLTIHETDNRLKRKLLKVARNLFILLGFLKKSSMYYYAYYTGRNRSSENTLILLRGKVHVKLASKIVQEDYTKLSFIVDSKRISKSNLKRYYPKSYEDLNYKRITIFSVRGIRAFIKYGNKNHIRLKELQVQTLLRGFDLNISYLLSKFYFAYYSVVRKVIKNNNVSDFVTFEESNLFGVLFSQAITPVVKKSCLVQHGFTVDFYAGMPLISDERWVWGEYFKTEYIRRGEEKERIKVKGKTLLNVKSLEEKKTISPQILLAPEYNQEISTLKNWVMDVLNILKRIDTDRIFVSIHPNQPGKSEITNWLENHNADIKVVSSSGNRELLDLDVVITGNTTVGFEAALLGKNVYNYHLKDQEIVYSYLKHPYIRNLRADYIKHKHTENFDLMTRCHLDFINKFVGEG